MRSPAPTVATCIPSARKSSACDGTITIRVSGNGEVDVDISPGNRRSGPSSTTSSVTIVRVPVVTAPAAVRKSALIGLSGALGRVSVALIAGEVLRHGRIDAKLRYVRHVEQWLGGPLQRGITARTGDVVADVDQAGSDDAGERCHDLLDTDHGIVVLQVFLRDSDLCLVCRGGGDVIVNLLQGHACRVLQVSIAFRREGREVAGSPCAASWRGRSPPRARCSPLPYPCS